MSPEELHYKVLRVLQANPETSQRELARELGISVGKVNYCLKALMERGWVKAQNFRNSRNKLAYTYLLTPRGIEEKTRTAVRFLRARLAEHEMLTHEIEQLRREVAAVSKATLSEE